MIAEVRQRGGIYFAVGDGIEYVGVTTNPWTRFHQHGSTGRLAGLRVFMYECNEERARRLEIAALVVLRGDHELRNGRGCPKRTTATQADTDDLHRVLVELREFVPGGIPCAGPWCLRCELEYHHGSNIERFTEGHAHHD